MERQTSTAVLSGRCLRYVELWQPVHRLEKGGFAPASLALAFKEGGASLWPKAKRRKGSDAC
jgi:hypothetical protein